MMHIVTSHQSKSEDNMYCDTIPSFWILLVDSHLNSHHSKIDIRPAGKCVLTIISDLTIKGSSCDGDPMRQWPSPCKNVGAEK